MGNIQVFAFVGYDATTQLTIPLAYTFWLQQTASRVVTAPGTVDKTDAIVWMFHEFAAATAPSMIRVLTADKCYSTHRAWLTFVIEQLAAATTLMTLVYARLSAVHGLELVNDVLPAGAKARALALLRSIGASAPLNPDEIGQHDDMPMDDTHRAAANSIFSSWFVERYPTLVRPIAYLLHATLFHAVNKCMQINPADSATQLQAEWQRAIAPLFDFVLVFPVDDTTAPLTMVWDLLNRRSQVRGWMRRGSGVCMFVRGWRGWWG